MSELDSGLEVSLRPVTPDDLPFMREMAYEAAFGGQNAASEEAPPSFEDAMQIPWIRAYCEEWGKAGDFGLIAVNGEGDNIGAAWYRRHEGSADGESYELSIAVREDKRQRSVGENLLRNLMDHAAEEGIPELNLKVSKRNRAAAKLYRKLGFLTIDGPDSYDNYMMVAPTNPGAVGEIAEMTQEKRNVLSEQPTPDVGGYFDAFAPLHDRYAEAGDWPAKADAFIKIAAGLKRGEPVRTALDLGAGTGMTVDAIMANTEPERLVALDVSSAMLGQMLKKRGDMPAVEPLVGSIERYLPDTRERFDLIASLTALEFVEDLPGVLKHVGRTLNEGGLFVATYLPNNDGSQQSETPLHSSYLRETLTRHAWPQPVIESALTSQGLDIVYRDASLPAFMLRGEWVYYNFLVAEKPPAAQ